MPTTVVQKVTQATDLDQLREILSEVLEKTCWRASLSYGDELTLHIGARIPYPQKSMAGKEKGAWILGTRGTAWIDHASGTLANSDEEPKILRQKIQVIEENTLTGIETSYPELALTVTFSNGLELRLFPGSKDDFNLPYWELFTPHQMILRVGPGAMWSYTSSGRFDS